MCFRKFFPGGVNDREMVDIIRVGALPRSPLKKPHKAMYIIKKPKKNKHKHRGRHFEKKRLRKTFKEMTKWMEYWDGPSPTSHLTSPEHHIVHNVHVVEEAPPVPHSLGIHTVESRWQQCSPHIKHVLSRSSIRELPGSAPTYPPLQVLTGVPIKIGL